MFQEIAEYTDNQLVALVRRDDADAFVELTKRYMSLIRAKAAPFHSTMLEADDLWQEGLLGLFRAARSYHPEGGASFRTYAGVCISHQMIAAYRSVVRQKNVPLGASVSLDDQDSQSLEGWVAQSASNPEALLIAREDLQIVNAQIQQRLSKLEQKVLSLYLGGCTYSDIAHNLGISHKSVDNAIQRFRRKLQDPSL